MNRLWLGMFAAVFAAGTVSAADCCKEGADCCKQHKECCKHEKHEPKPAPKPTPETPAPNA
jgi:hypothetical protein